MHRLELIFGNVRTVSVELTLCRPTERERTECLIKAKLRNIMTFQDLENITSKEVRPRRIVTSTCCFIAKVSVNKTAPCFCRSAMSWSST